MENSHAIREALERNATIVAVKPAVGQRTAVTRVRLAPGLACHVADGPWSFEVGMTDKYGGTDAAPNPGVYGRAALGSCLALGYSMWAARLGVEIDSLEVEVRADYDVRGELGVSDAVRPGYTQVHYIVSIASPASEADILRVLDTAERHSPWLDDIRNPVPVSREVRFTAAERA